jgi:hypothetical protein
VKDAVQIDHVEALIGKAPEFLGLTDACFEIGDLAAMGDFLDRYRRFPEQGRRFGPPPVLTSA